MLLFDVETPLTHEKTLAKTLCKWIGEPSDSILYQSVIAVNLALQEGHSCLYIPEWAGQTLQVGSQYSCKLPTLRNWQNYLSTLPLGIDDQFPLVFEQNRLYLRRYWAFEQELSESILDRLNEEPAELKPPVLARFSQLFPETAERDWQKIAAYNSLLNQFSVIAGGPGTGKTFTVTRLLACLLAQYDRAPIIKLVAPTGKAAQRLSESISKAKADLTLQTGESWVLDIPEEASTIHRLLGVIPNSIDFRHNSGNPIQVDCLLVDEASMVDLPLMTRLFRALPRETRVILLGDAEQLPSVAAGSVLADITPRPHPGYSAERAAILELPVTSGKVTANYLTYLEKSHRFDGKGGIGILAAQVIRGALSESWATLESDNDQLNLISEQQRESQLSQWIESYYRPVLKSPDIATAWLRFSEFRILCATRVGPQGTVSLNEKIVLQLKGKQIGLFKGLPLMVTQNDYKLELFNGDVGIVWPDDQNKLMVWFPESLGGYRPVSIARLPAYDLVFAMTIHKTQGSEFSQVAMVLPDRASQLLSRELIYTGLTRAKKMFSYCGSKQTWSKSVSQRVIRYSGLAMKLGLETDLIEQTQLKPVQSKPMQLDMDL